MTIQDRRPANSAERTVFISHSTKDGDLVRWLAEQVRAAGHTAYVAPWDHQPGAVLTDKVSANLKSADAYILLLTENGYDSVYVQHEVALAVDSGKPLIALLAPTVSTKPLGTLAGIEYVSLDPDDLAASTAAITTGLAHLNRERGVSVPPVSTPQPILQVSLQMNAEFHVTANELLVGVCALALIVGLIYVVNNGAAPSGS